MEKEQLQTIANPVWEMTVNNAPVEFLESSTRNILDADIAAITSFITTTPVENLTEENKTELYTQGKGLWDHFSEDLRKTKFNLLLNRVQYNYLTDLLLKKMEYTTETVFFAIELTQFLYNMKETSKFENDTQVIKFPITPTDLTYLYHVLSKHTVIGLTKSSFTFAEILRRIGDISKIFNYYDNESKELSTQLLNWMGGMDTIQDTVQGNVA